LFWPRFGGAGPPKTGPKLVSPFVATWRRGRPLGEQAPRGCPAGGTQGLPRRGLFLGTERDDAGARISQPPGGTPPRVQCFAPIFDWVLAPEGSFRGQSLLSTKGRWNKPVLGGLGTGVSGPFWGPQGQSRCSRFPSIECIAGSNDLWSEAWRGPPEEKECSLFWGRGSKQKATFCPLAAQGGKRLFWPRCPLAQQGGNGAKASFWGGLPPQKVVLAPSGPEWPKEIEIE